MIHESEYSPPAGRAREVYSRLEKANVLDKIPDHVDPYIIFGQDDESDVNEVSSQVCKFCGDIPNDASSMTYPYCDCSNIRLNSKGGINKSNDMYDGFMKRISNLKLTPDIDSTYSFPDSTGSHMKINDNTSSMLLINTPQSIGWSTHQWSNTPQSIEWSTTPQSVKCQQSANSSISNIEVATHHESLCGFTEMDRSNESSKIVWKGPNFLKMNSSMIMPMKTIPFLESTPVAPLNVPIPEGSWPIEYAPKKDHSVGPIRYPWPENMPQTPELELGNYASKGKTLFSNNLEMQQLKLNVPFKETFAQLDEACSPIQQTPEYGGFLQINGKEYYILSQLSAGGSSKVFSAYDQQIENIIAIKCVDLTYGDASFKDCFLKEIEYLKMLKDSKHVIKLLDYELRKDEMFLVMEKGDTDLAHFLTDAKRMKSLTPLMIKFYWSQMLRAVWEIHQFGIIHSDLKPANFLLVSGHLKLIDFGISTSVPTDMTSAIRNYQIGTINFMSPEAAINYGMTLGEKIFAFKIGTKADVWSLGCILYNLVYGHTPFQKFRLFSQKLEALKNPEYPITFPSINDPYLLDVLKKCLKRNPKERATVDELLNHPYLEKEDIIPETNDHVKELIAKISILSSSQQSIVMELVEKLSRQPKI